MFSAADIDLHLVIPVLFRPTNQVLHYDGSDFPDLRCGEAVVAETRFGPQLGWVYKSPRMMKLPEPLTHRLLEQAKASEVQSYFRLREQARKDKEFIHQKVREYDLPMRILDAEYPLDENQFVVYFVAEGRIDFRALVADLKQSFPKRVMLFQIGARDAIRMIGAVSLCGRLTCCTTYLRCFESVTMKMAKDQMLDLNPARLLGVCGKLKCCLRYEYDLYRQLLEYLPKVGQTIDTPQGKGRVINLNVLRLQVTVELESGGYSSWKVGQLPGYENPSPDLFGRDCESCAKSV